MSPSTSETKAAFVCDCKYWMRSACAGEPFYREHQGKRYCVLHFPGKEKSADFRAALLRKLDNKDFDFCGVWFPGEVSFAGFTLSAEANFQYAFFSEKAAFMGATFSAKASFNYATFSAEASFGNATFSAGAYFICATFSGAADFRYTTFSAKANFDSATFAIDVRFAGSEMGRVFEDTSSLDLRFARIENPDRVSFHTVTLHPHWFINVDPRKFDFTNVEWKNKKAKAELALLITKKASADGADKSPHRLLSQACQRLAANCEENSRYREASHFRGLALDAERWETWQGFDFRRLNWWYWIASGYGERPFQALLVLIGILVLFGLLYTQVGFARWEPRVASEADAAIAQKDKDGVPLGFPRALSYSAGVMTLQKPEPKPATSAAQFVVLFETILGPVQGALLALAIRRKFMR